MGHLTRFLEFDGNAKENYISGECNDICKKESDYYGGLYNPIRFEKNTIFQDSDEAQNWIDLHDKGDYDNLAVRYYDIPDMKSKKIDNLKERLNKEKIKLKEWTNKHSIKTFKSAYVGCSKCGSKLSKKHLYGECCPLCRNDLRSETTLKGIERYNENIENLNKQILEEQRALKKKKQKNAKTKWLVKIEYHV